MHDGNIFVRPLILFIGLVHSGVRVQKSKRTRSYNFLTNSANFRL